MNAMYPERFTRDEARSSSACSRCTEGAAQRRRPRGGLRAPPRALPARAARAAASACARRRSRPCPSSSSRASDVDGAAAARRRTARLMPNVEEILEGQRICICAGSGGVGKTTTSAALAAGLAARGQKVGVLTIDPAKRLADSLGLEELGNEPRQVDPDAVRARGDRDEGRAVGDDARRQGDLRRAGRASTPPTRRRATASSRTGSTARSRTRSPAPRSTWRWRSSSRSTRRAASTSSSSTRPPRATPSTSSTRRSG